MREICWNLALPLPSKNFFLVFQDFFKMSWRRLQRNKFSSYVCNTSSNNVFKTSWRCLQVVFARRLQDVFKTFLRRLQDVFARRLLQDVFKKSSRKRLAIMSWSRLEDAFKMSWKTKIYYPEDIFKTSSRRLQYVFAKANVSWVMTKLNCLKA